MAPVNIQQAYLQTNQGIPQQPYYVNQPITYQPLYNQAVIVNPGQPNIIINQGGPIIYTPIEFNRRRVKMVCPYCNNSIKTKVEQRFNCCTFCTFFLCIILLLLALANGNGSSDCNCNCSSRERCCCCCCCCCCYEKTAEQVEEEEDEQCCDCFNDAIHTCPSCGRVLGKFTSGCF